MLFSKQFWDPIRTGDVTVTFRRWKRPQAVADRTYRSPAGRLHVTAVVVVEPDSITAANAERAGHDSADSLRAQLRGNSTDPVYRVDFRYLDEPDPRDLLAANGDLTADDISEIAKRLSRLDKASRHGVWTHEYLNLIEDHPGVRAPDLAELVGRETQPFKTDVRKLKNLGLTISLRIGYELTRRGQTYVEKTEEATPPPGAKER